MQLRIAIKSFLLLFCVFWVLGFKPAPVGSFVVKFRQDSIEYKIRDNNVRMKKAPFVIQVEMKDLAGVYVNASFNSSFFDKCDQMDCKSLGDVIAKSMAETDFNADKEMMVEDSSYSFWFYDSLKPWHRFDKGVSQVGGVTIATKTVNKFNIPSKNLVMEISDSPEFLYLVFFSILENKSDSTKSILQRTKLKVKWKTKQPANKDSQ